MDSGERHALSRGYQQVGAAGLVTGPGFGGGRPADERRSAGSSRPRGDYGSPGSPGPGAPPGGRRPGRPGPDGSRPDGSRPDGSRPDGSRPGGYRPGGYQPDGRRAGGSGPDGYQGGSGAAGRGPQAGYGPAPRRRGPSSLRLVWVYPDLLSTYGDRGNLLVLERRARLRGLAVDSVIVHADQAVPRQGDIYLLGGGEDLPQILAARRLRADGGLSAAAANGAVVFAVCAGYQLLGTEFGGEEGQPLPGLEILDIGSGRGDRRGVGEIVADVDPSLGVPRLTGFENHQGMTRLGPGARPLAQVKLGVGNGDGTEGAFAGRVLGTYLHGPALVRNPGLADLLLSWVAGSLPPLAARDEEWTLRLREERLAAVAPASG